MKLFITYSKLFIAAQKILKFEKIVLKQDQQKVRKSFKTMTN